MKKYDNFCNALKNLKDIYKYEEPYDNVTLIGLVALYSICFEQSWKAMKEIMTYNGVIEAETGSPRSIIKLAYSVGMITQEKVWLDALVSRNNVAHSYNQAIALDIVRATKDRYVEMFEALQTNIQENFLN
ncbi:MAG: nucleotidyltransferase [Lachnospiraceae bacterium]|nr:nucleotidyltransferase [Lachnospiraceae bacterium]